MRHAELTEAQFQLCQSQGNQACFQLITMSPHNTPSCALALFQDDHEAIKTLCEVKYITNHKVRPAIVDLGKGKLLIQSTNEKLTETCRGQVPTEIDVCKFCIIDLACDCELRSHNIYVPPSLANCDDATIPTIVTHSQNLPFITSFYNGSQINASHLYRDFHKSTNIPQFSISVSEWDTFAASDRELSSDMNKIVGMIQNDSHIYYSPVEYLLDTSFHGFTRASRNAVVIAQFFAFGLLTITYILCITNYLRYRRMSTALMTLTMSLPKSNANPIKIISRDDSFAETETEFYDGVIILATALVVLQILYVLYRVIAHTRCGQQIIACFRQKLAIASPVSIYIELTTARESAQLCVTRIAYTQSAVYFTETVPLTNLHVEPGCLNNSLRANWSPLFISVNPETPVQLTLPAEIPIPIGLGATIARIIQEEHFICMLVGTERTKTVIPCGPPTASPEIQE